MYKQHVTVVAAGGGANLNYIIFSFIFIKPRGREVINGRRNKKKQSSDTHTCFLFFFLEFFSNLWFLVRYWISCVRNLEGKKKSLFGGAANNS